MFVQEFIHLKLHNLLTYYKLLCKIVSHQVHLAKISKNTLTTYKYIVSCFLSGITLTKTSHTVSTFMQTTNSDKTRKKCDEKTNAK